MVDPEYIDFRLLDELKGVVIAKSAEIVCRTQVGKSALAGPASISIEDNL
jgi:hypothetical protein